MSRSFEKCKLQAVGIRLVQATTKTSHIGLSFIIRVRGHSGFSSATSLSLHTMPRGRERMAFAAGPYHVMWYAGGPVSSRRELGDRGERSVHQRGFKEKTFLHAPSSRIRPWLVSGCRKGACRACCDNVFSFQPCRYWAWLRPTLHGYLIDCLAARGPIWQPTVFSLHALTTNRCGVASFG